MKQKFQTALCLYIAVLLFGLAAILGKACANDTHQEIQSEKQYEEMDYQFFNGDAEAYPLIANKD
ncbi:TPA: hypothetical protein ACFP4Q_000799 [Neisseria weaveri]